MNTEITFYSPTEPKNRAILDVGDLSTADIKRISKLQHEQGRNELKFKHGFPARCPFCNVITDLLPYPDSSRICKYCNNMLLEGRIYC
jgi:hypothetical protein